LIHQFQHAKPRSKTIKRNILRDDKACFSGGRDGYVIILEDSITPIAPLCDFIEKVGIGLIDILVDILWRALEVGFEECWFVAQQFLVDSESFSLRANENTHHFVLEGAKEL
jgi:hypothetical protein